MKSFRVLFISLLAVNLLSGCATYTFVSTGSGPSITGSRNFVEKSYDLTGFDSIEVSGGASVEISRGDTAAVKITVNDNAADYVKVEKQGQTLVIGLMNGSFKNVSIKAVIEMPELVGVSASGGSHVKFDSFTTTKPAAFKTSGGSDIRGTIDTGPAQVTAFGGANITLDGGCQSLALKHSGGGKVKLGAFRATDANVDVSGGSHSEINATGRVTGLVSGGGELRVAGRPASVDVDVSGGGSLLR